MLGRTLQAEGEENTGMVSMYHTTDHSLIHPGSSRIYNCLGTEKEKEFIKNNSRKLHLCTKF